MPVVGDAQRVRSGGTTPPGGGAASEPNDANQIYLSNLDWGLCVNGWGTCEEDRSNGETGAADGNTLTMAGLTYSKGLGVHSTSRVHYALNKQCTSFKATIGVDDETGSSGSVVFKVYGGYSLTANSATTALYTSGTFTGDTTPAEITVDVTNRTSLTLEVTDAGDGASADHADWGFARVICTAPAGTSVAAGTGTLQTAITAGGTGVTYVLGAGLHYVATAVVPKTSTTITSAAGAMIHGGRLLTGWTSTTCGGQPCWYVDSQTQEGSVGDGEADKCYAAYSAGPACYLPEDLFFDWEIKKRTTSTTGAAGYWRFDYTADRIYVYDDPTGKQVETSVTASLFGSTSNVDTVTLTNSTVQMFATPTYDPGCVNISNPAAGSTDWVVQDSEIRYCHSAGVYTDSGASIARRNYVHHNGVYGFGGAGAFTIDDNEVSYNNTIGYDPFWGAGGSKWVYSSATISDNFSHHNRGPGFWTDINNQDGIYSGNLIEDNDRAGIFHEVSYDWTISGNTVSRNGFWEDGVYDGYGAGIQIMNSRNVTVSGNTLKDNAQGIKGILDPSRPGPGDDGAWDITGLLVTDNDVCQLTGESSGLDAGSDADYYDGGAKNNAFTLNRYTDTNVANLHSWRAANRTFAVWQGTYSQDTGGSRTLTASCP